MGVTTTQTNKPINPRGNDASPKGYNRASLFSGKALDFDGVNDGIEINPYVQSGNTMSISFYMKQDAVSNTVRMICESNNIGKLMIHTGGIGSGGMRLGLNNTDFFDVDNAVPDTDMHFYSMVYDSVNTHAYLYRDGVLFTDEVIDLGDLATTSSFFISSRLNTQYNFDGQMAGFKIFNTALTAAQVADLYNNPEKVVPTGVDNTALKLWLPMQEGAGTTAYDGSGNGNHGTISGATYTHGIGAPVSQTAVIDWNKQSYFAGNAGDDTYYNLNLPNWNTQTAVTMYAEFVWQGGSSPQQILDWGGNSGFRIRLDSNDNLQLLNTGGINILSSTTSPTLNAFNRVAVKGDSNGLKIFFNGTEVASNSTALNVSQSVTEFYIGRFSSVAGEYFAGVIPEAKVWTSALTDAQLESLTAGTTNPEDYTSGALAHWTGASEYKDQVGSYDLTALGSPVRFIAPQGLTSGRDTFNALFENVRKQGALNLDGNSWAEVHDNESLDFGAGSFTLEAWVKAKYINQGSVFNMVISLGDNITSSNNAGLMLLNNNVPYFIYSNPGASSGSAQTEGDWIHIVGTYDETNTTLYVNGSQADQDARTASDITNGFAKLIGRDGTDLNRFYNDQIAQPRIYNRALTAEEVQRNYNAGKNTYTN